MLNIKHIIFSFIYSWTLHKISFIILNSKSNIELAKHYYALGRSMVNNKHSIDHLLEFRLVCNWKYLVNHFEVKFKNFNVNIRIWYFAIHYVSLSFTINIDSKHVFIFSKLVPLKIDRLKRNYLTKPLHSRNLHEQYCSSFNAHEFWWSTLSMSIRSLLAQKLMCLCIMCLSVFIHFV